MVMAVWEFIPGILLSGRYPIITRLFGKLLMVRNAVTCMVIALAALLCVSCSAGGDIRVVSIEQVSPGEANIVVRISNGDSADKTGYRMREGYIAFLHDDGTGIVGTAGAMEGASVLWSPRGVTYGTETYEYLTTDEGATRFTRETSKPYELQRYEFPNEDVGALFVLQGQQTVDVLGTGRTLTSVANAGIFQNNGQCGSRIVSITDTKLAPSVALAAFEAYSAQSNDGEVPENMAVVVQLTDHDGDVPPVLAVAPMIDGLTSGQNMFSCEGDVVTMPSFQATYPNASRDNGLDANVGTMVLQRWDLSTGQRTIIPVVDAEGGAIELNEERTIHLYEGIQVGNEYRFISANGDAFAVDVTSGQGRYLFSIPSRSRDHSTVFQVTATGVYALEDRGDDRVVTLFYRPWDGEEQRELFTTSDLGRYLKGTALTGQMDIQSFALRPGWDGGAQ